MLGGGAGGGGGYLEVEGALGSCCCGGESWATRPHGIAAAKNRINQFFMRGFIIAAANWYPDRVSYLSGATMSITTRCARAFCVLDGPALLCYSKKLGYFMKMFRLLRFGAMCGLGALLMSCSLAASAGRSREITDIHFENVTQTTVDVVWTTAHPSTSQVLIARSTDYEPERWAPEQPDKTLVTAHRVTVDHLIPYNPKNGDGTYYIYVASVDGKGQGSTAPGPQTPDGKNPLMPMRTRPTDATGEPKFDFYTLGPDEVFAGHDMYFLVQAILIAGKVDDLYVINQGGYNNDTDGVVKSLEGKGNPDTIGVHFNCTWTNAAGVDTAEQTLDRTRSLGFCNDLNNNIRDLTFRLRTKPNTVPGKYSITFTLETNGKKEGRHLRIHGAALADGTSAS